MKLQWGYGGLELTLWILPPYVYDAWDRKLILIGGVTGREANIHDWYNLLTMINRLDKHDEIANFMNSLGKITLFFSFVWGGVILYKIFFILKIRGFKNNETPVNPKYIETLDKFM